jgi:alcohol dehydrogenase (cytochrome c)
VVAGCHGSALRGNAAQHSNGWRGRPITLDRVRRQSLWADTGVWKWRLKSNYPIFGAVTPTAGGLVFFGDMGGNFYALDAATGQKLWGQKIGGAIGGGVITYTVNGAQKVAVATGYVSPALPVEIRRAKIAILGVEGDATRQ